MSCKPGAGTTHYYGCDCHEDAWALKLAEAMAENAKLVAVPRGVSECQSCDDCHNDVTEILDEHDSQTLTAHNELKADSNVCECGHYKHQHIYEESACRPGFVCDDKCQKFRARPSAEREVEK